MERKYPHLFSPLEIRGKVFRNRIFSAPNMIFQVVDGRPTDYYVGYLAEKARGGAAVVTLGEVNICDGSSHTPRMLLNEKNMNIFGEITSAIKENGALACAELTHGGRNTQQKYNTVPLMGPNDELSKFGDKVRAMTEADMYAVAEAYADAACYVRDCGFDIAHVHAGHGWLFAQFISPLVNRRTDNYGGSFENRIRFPLMCLKRMREKVGSQMILSMRISGSEREEGGFTPDDIAEFISRAEEYIDFIEVSTEGWEYCMPSAYMDRCLNAPFADAIRNSGKVHIPVFVVGCVVDPDDAEQLIAQGKVDGVSMARALIADPELPGKSRAGRPEDVRPCLRCMCCTDGDNRTKSFHCTVNPITGHETRLCWDGTVRPAKYRKKILIAGGGPAGMVAAVTAAKRGHQVILCEKSGSLGGVINYALVDTLKTDLLRYRNYLVRQTELSGAEIRLNTEVTPEYIEREAPDHLIVATGSDSVVPRFLKGYEAGIDIMDMYHDVSTVKGENVVIIGAGLSGVEAGIFLAELMGKKVTILEKFTALSGVGKTYGWGVMRAVQSNGVEIIEGADCLEVLPEGVRYAKDGAEHLAKADTVIYAMGRRTNKSLYYAAVDKVPFLDLVGDCKEVGQIRGATSTGWAAAMHAGSF